MRVHRFDINVKIELPSEVMVFQKDMCELEHKVEMQIESLAYFKSQKGD